MSQHAGTAHLQSELNRLQNELNAVKVDAPNEMTTVGRYLLDRLAQLGVKVCARPLGLMWVLISAENVWCSGTLQSRYARLMHCFDFVFTLSFSQDSWISWRITRSLTGVETGE